MDLNLDLMACTRADGFTTDMDIPSVGSLAIAVPELILNELPDENPGELGGLCVVCELVEEEETGDGVMLLVFTNVGGIALELPVRCVSRRLALVLF